MAITKYVPASAGQLPVSPLVRQYLDEELSKIADIINTGELIAEPLAAAPARPENGLIAYADGVNWDPGSGAGFYGYEAGAWVKL